MSHCHSAWCPQNVVINPLSNIPLRMSNFDECPKRRGGLLGPGTRGEGEEEEWKLKPGATLEDQGCCGLSPEQQNVKAVSAQHCATTSVLCNCCPNCYAERSHKDSVHSSAIGIGKQLKRKKSNFQAQLHLRTLDLFWANLRAQHHLPPLDLVWTLKSI